MDDEDVLHALYTEARGRGFPTTKCDDGIVIAGNPVRVRAGLARYPIPTGGTCHMAIRDEESVARVVDRVTADCEHHRRGRREQ